MVRDSSATGGWNWNWIYRKDFSIQSNLIPFFQDLSPRIKSHEIFWSSVSSTIWLLASHWKRSSHSSSLILLNKWPQSRVISINHRPVFIFPPRYAHVKKINIPSLSDVARIFPSVTRSHRRKFSPSFSNGQLNHLVSTSWNWVEETTRIPCSSSKTKRGELPRGVKKWIRKNERWESRRFLWWWTHLHQQSGRDRIEYEIRRRDRGGKGGGGEEVPGDDNQIKSVQCFPSSRLHLLCVG